MGLCPSPYPSPHTKKHIAILLKCYRVLTWIVLKTKCQEKEMQKGKRIVSRGLKNRWEKKRSKRQRRKGSSVQLLSRLQLFATPWLQHTSLPCPSPTPGVYWNSYLSSRRCHPTISSSVIPFSSRLQSFPASGSFPLSQFFASSGKSIGVSASASVLPMDV